MNADQLLGLLRQIIDPGDPAVRERAADELTDWTRSYSAAETITLATVLSATAARETSHLALEAQLHALLELTSTGHVEVAHMAHLREIDLAELPAELRGYLADLDRT
ncbi:hypothetical protein OG601_22600 [Streptomyces sp. NBC_01239]|uniref:hypothetical protein n=1 Tax=Streptomyces sp. NBC_01239 TaxID=2903792 RepID=UPI00225B66B0|nr:hypothetical protein [Streptomyces sp. NBC_01239]MCX4813388.1 hypothetical protein [Streptomyces sp. NBC_01239]